VFHGLSAYKPQLGVATPRALQHPAGCFSDSHVATAAFVLARLARLAFACTDGGDVLKAAHQPALHRIMSEDITHGIARMRMCVC
jgi:hypothetical protein